MTDKQLDEHKTPAPTGNKHNPKKYDTGYGVGDVAETSQRDWVNKADKMAKTNRTKQKSSPAAIEPAGRPKT